jgi:hypothetical protein
MTDQTPSIGRIVHYVGGEDREYPAIITRVLHNGERDGCVMLTVFAPKETVPGVESRYDPERSHVCSWHWPERVS